jgi:hypothetical protein
MKVEKRIKSGTASTVPDISKLLEQYGGPVKFTGDEDALYERHLVFDNVMEETAIGVRERFEAIARSVRDVLSQRWVATEKTYERENAKRVVTQWSKKTRDVFEVVERYVSLRSRRKHRACGGAKRNRWQRANNLQPATRATDESFSGTQHDEFTVAIVACALAPGFAGSKIFSTCSWGSRPRLYASACFSGWIFSTNFRDSTLARK